MTVTSGNWVRYACDNDSYFHRKTLHLWKEVLEDGNHPMDETFDFLQQERNRSR